LTSNRSRRGRSRGRRRSKVGWLVGLKFNPKPKVKQLKKGKSDLIDVLFM